MIPQHQNKVTKTKVMKLNENVLNVIRQVAANKGNRFASLVYTAKGTEEKARHTILIGFDYHRAVVESAKELQAMQFADGTIEREAQLALLASFTKTLAAHSVGKQNEDYTKKDTYENVELDGQPVNGIRYNTVDGSFKLFGLSVKKTVLEMGVYHTAKSKPLTIAKDKLEKLLPVSKVREYRVSADNLASAKMNGETLEM